jgi:DNA-directed RNA polymerases I, II, and III subunit RPABC1
MSECLNIMYKRGYTLINKNDNYTLMKDTEDNFIILFECKDALTIHNMKIYLQIMSEHDIVHCIIIYSDKITPSAKKIIDISSEYEIEVFTENEMSINITNHKYYFPHIKVNDDVKQTLLNKYGKNLPIILKTDQVVKYLHFKKGDILKIIRKNDYIHYRIVK